MGYRFSPALSLSSEWSFGTGSYGAGLARHMAAAGVQVVEVDRADRQDPWRRLSSASRRSSTLTMALEQVVDRRLFAAELQGFTRR